MSNELLLTIILAGFIGGITNYFRTEHEKFWRPFLKNILMGFCASFIMPLFLNMTSSNLIAESIHDNSKLLILFGFCLVASLSAETFIQSIAKHLLKEVKTDVENLKKDVEPLVSKETEPQEMNTEKNKSYDFSGNTKKVLQTLGSGKYAWRSPSGIAKETQMTQDSVLRELHLLESKQLVVMTRKRGRFGLTLNGRIAYSNFF